MRTGSIAEDGHPLIHARRLRAVAPERRHDVAAAELVGDIAPEQSLGVLVAVEDDDLGGAEPVACRIAGTISRRSAGIGREQPEGDQAVGLAAAHRLGQIERAVFALPASRSKPRLTSTSRPAVK